jgi:hypothetical protein
MAVAVAVAVPVAQHLLLRLKPKHQMEILYQDLSERNMMNHKKRVVGTWLI